ncbi:hypothetical protein MRX96_000441 [Rhipicephalus microplus]
MPAKRRQFPQFQFGVEEDFVQCRKVVDDMARVVGHGLIRWKKVPPRPVLHIEPWWAEEAAAAISLVPQPSQLHLVPTLQEGSKAELQDYQESVASTPADSEEQASTDSSSPTSSSSWEHNTPPSSSPSLSPSPKGLALFRTGICADGPGRQQATQQASFAAPPKRARAHSAPPATTFCPCLLAVQACRAGRQEDLFGEGCARSAVSPLFPGEGTRMTSTGRATEATLESLAQAGASQTATGNPTLLEPSPPSSGHATRPTRPPERAASPVSDGVVCLPPTSSPQQQHSPPLSQLKGEHGRVVCYGRSSSELCR